MDITANGFACLTGSILEKESGPWTGRIEVDEETGAIDGTVVIIAGTTVWNGTVTSGRVESGRYIAELIGGAGGLTTVLDAKYYYQTTLATIVADLMTETGEVLDIASSSPDIFTHVVPAWLRAKGEARLALQAIANELGGYWRVTRLGLVSIQTDETWLPVVGPYVEESRDPGRNSVVIAPDEAPEAYDSQGPLKLVGNKVILNIVD